MSKTLLSAKAVEVEKRRYPSKHYVYVIEVSWSEGTQTVIYRRYSAFFEFQCGLLLKFPVEAGTKNPVDRCIPFLPGKILFGRSHVRSVAEKRLGQINDYCQTLIRLPSHISDDSYVKNFFEVTPEDINPPCKKEKKKSSDNSASEISDPVLLEQYTAVADYKKQKNTECNLTAGQVVEVVDKNENGWWFVHLDDLNEGWVPATYLESVYGKVRTPSPITLKPGEEEVYITTSNYTAKNNDELTFERGVLIEVFQKGLDGWWKGRYQTKEGFVPACYLFRYYGPMNTAEGVQVVSTMQDAVESSRKESVSVSSKKPFSGAGKSQQPASKGLVSIGGIKMKAGIDPYADEPIYAPTPRKEEVEAKKKLFPVPKILSPKSKPSISSSNSCDSFDSDSDNDSTYAKPDILFGKKSPEAAFGEDDEDVSHDYETLSEHYMTIADFQAQANDGLSFQEGTEVSVITKNPSGWWFVESGQKEGWVPSSYLQKSYKPHGNGNDSNAKPKPPPPKRNDLPRSNSSSDTNLKTKSKPPPPVRRDTTAAAKTPIGLSISNNSGSGKPTGLGKPKPAPPVRRDLPSTNGHSTNEDSVDLGGGGGKKSPPIPAKPRPGVSKKPVTGPKKSFEGGSVSAMAAVLSQGLGKPTDKQPSSDNRDDRRPTVSARKSMIPPQRNQNTPEITIKSDSLKRSSSSESLREINRPTDERVSKTPYPSRPLNKQLSDSSTNKPMKFLRKSQENLLAAQGEENQEEKVSPVPVTRKSVSNVSPKFVPKFSKPSNSNSKPKPPPPSRNHIPPSSSQTLKLAGLERALKSGKSPPAVPTATKRNNVSSSNIKKKPSPPSRPKSSPTSTAKKTPPPRPGNSPALTKKGTYVTISDYCGYDDSSISFSEGESVKVLEKNSNGWWYVEMDGDREGWVPSTFIEKSEKPDRPSPPIKVQKPAAPRPKPRPPVRKDNMCRAVADYSPPVYEDSGISLIENEEYEILEKSDHGWWFLKKDDVEGWAPSSFLESL